MAVQQIKFHVPEILSELITEIKPYCAGVHIQALGWEKHVPKLIKGLGL
jgi:hypothetical protein